VKTYKNFAFLSLMLFTVLASSPAISQEMAPPFQSFEDIDIDLSGEISIDEANTYHIRVFALFDVNRDGSLTRAEFVGKRTGPEAFGFCSREIHDLKEERFDAWEQNGDEQLSKAEFLSGALSCFARADEDGNSELNQEEYGSGV
tara:strand:+ start:5390 stop:5824 length:435 start_codon:yes stop_codon:yes gene_type:complete